MNTLIHSEVFFFVSSIGFIIMGLLVAILLVFCVQAVSSFIRILAKIETSMDEIGDATMELIEDMRENVFFRLFFHPKKSHHINK